MKNLGFALVIIGILMVAYTGFNYVTTEKVAEIGPLQVNATKNHPVQWSPILGGVLIIGGIIVLSLKTNKS